MLDFHAHAHVTLTHRLIQHIRNDTVQEHWLDTDQREKEGECTRQQFPNAQRLGWKKCRGCSTKKRESNAWAKNGAR